MRTFDVYLSTTSTVKGNAIHDIHRCRTHEEAIRRSIEFHYLTWDEVQRITVTPRDFRVPSQT
jgi:hypothetical protein